MNKTAESAIAHASDDTRRLNPHLYGASSNARQVVAQDKRLRQNSKSLLNKLEAEWLVQIETMYPHATVWKQALRWRLGNGIWYKPDFAAFCGWTQKPTGMTCWEVKGPHAFRGGFENLKVAASVYSEVRWVLVWKQNGEWRQQEVLS